MRIKRLEVFRFPVPFKTVFRHASATRAQAENLIVAAHSVCGQVGYGEGCPRRYVTGETVEGGVAFIREHADALTDAVRDEQSLRTWIGSHRTLIDQNPAAFCAVEIALLDLIGKVKQCPVEDLVGVPRLAGRVTYSAVLGDAPSVAYWWQFRRYWKQGFRDFKVKVSGNLRRDHGKMRVFKNRTDPLLRVPARRQQSLDVRRCVHLPREGSFLRCVCDRRAPSERRPGRIRTRRRSLPDKDHPG